MIDLYMTGGIDGITVKSTETGASYTVSGTLLEDMYMNMTMNYVNDATGTPATATINGTYDIDMAYEYALSVKRSDGVSAKYIVSLTAAGSGNVTGEEDPNITGGGTLKVYDDANTLQYEVTLNPNDL